MATWTTVALVLISCTKITSSDETITEELDCNDWEECQNIEFPITDDDLSKSIACNGASSCVAAKISATSDISCNGFQSCDNGQIYTSDGDIMMTGLYSCVGCQQIEASNGEVSCSGEAACFKAHITTGGDNIINCDGSNGCCNSKLSAQNSLTECAGNSGCAQSHLLDTAKYAICNGFYGCYYAKLEIGSGEIFCYGSHSCETSDIHVTDIQGYGEYALNGATISSQYLQGDLNVESFGWHSGSGATVTCHCGKTCNVYCAGNGCLDMTFKCEMGSKCNLYCDEEHGIDCPTFLDHTVDEDITCTDDSAVAGSDAEASNHKTYSSAGHGDSRDENASMEDQEADTIKLCKNTNECQDFENMVYKEGELQCTGFQSCASSELYATTAITCSGSESCIEAKSIKSDGDILCNGNIACQASTEIISTGSDIICSGPESCADISNIMVQDWNSIQCTGSSACSTSSLNTELGDIMCDGRNACANAKVFNKVHNSVWCNGHKACAKMLVSNIEGSVECHGTDSCKQANINTRYVIGHGYRSLQKSVIDSEGIEEMMIEAYGYYAGDGATIDCRSGSICTLICFNNGCEGLVFNCQGSAECSFECDEDQNIKCPEYNEIIQIRRDEKKLLVNNGLQQKIIDYHIYNIVFYTTIFSIVLFVGYRQFSKCRENKDYQPILE